MVQYLPRPPGGALRTQILVLGLPYYLNTYFVELYPARSYVTPRGILAILNLNLVQL
eukprot:SAG31_NODE_2200_length_6208_cov_2.781306_7_plen_57_part_00